MAEISKPDYTYLWSSGGAIVAPSNAKVQTGWTAEVPPFQWENWSQNRQDQGIAHILQHGISVWDALTEYQSGKSYVQGSDGNIYKARTTNTNNNPVADVTFTNWTRSNSGGLLNIQTFTTTAVYTPTPGTNYIVVKAIGAGGAGGGTSVTNSTQISIGSGGGAGAYAESKITSAFAGVTVTVGVGGAGVVGGNGGAGGTTSFGALMTCPGGPGGQFGGTAPNSTDTMNPPTTRSSISTGGNILNTSGSVGGVAIYIVGVIPISGAGANSHRGTGGQNINYNVGQAGNGFGSGGSGACANISTAAQAGGNGAGGFVEVWEYS